MQHWLAVIEAKKGHEPHRETVLSDLWPYGFFPSLNVKFLIVSEINAKSIWEENHCGNATCTISFEKNSQIIYI
jgi:hypothetical protein